MDLKTVPGVKDSIEFKYAKGGTLKTLIFYIWRNKMSTKLKRRVEKMEKELHPPRFLILEDILRRIHLEGQEVRTAQEGELLKELNETPVDPVLEKKLQELHENRDEPNHKEEEMTENDRKG
ncbi:hypothetical protein ACFL0H_09575 [Thermodesulfobacteriota bacterium]